MTTPDDAQHFDPSNKRLVEARDGPGTWVSGPPPAPITRDDLARFFRELRPELPAELKAGLAEDVGRVGVSFSLDILLGIAEFSPEHSERIREYLEWTPEHMAAETKRVMDMLKGKGTR